MKKIICSIVAMCLITVTVFAAELTDVQKSDLYKLGIMVGDENGNLRLDSNITRAEVAKMLCVAGSIKLSQHSGGFKDVAESYWAYGYINAAKEKGIINGDGSGNFNPNKNITNEEIVKMIVCLLGYGEMAEMRGGYPAGYTALASNLGITNGLKLKAETPAVKRDVAIMIFNALDIPLMAEKSKENEEEDDSAVVYVIMDGKNGVPLSTLRKNIK